MIRNFCIDKKGKERETSIIVRIFGEVYGAEINKGGIYSNEKHFRVFDIQIGEHFISFYKVKEICKEIGLKIVPVVDEKGTEFWLHCLHYDCLKEILLNGFVLEENSYLFDEENLDHSKIVEEGGSGGFLEGFVIISEPLLLNEYGQRIKAKIKKKDFTGEE